MAILKCRILILILFVVCAISSGCLYKKAAIRVGPEDPIITAADYDGPAYVYDAAGKLRYVDRVIMPAGSFMTPRAKNLPGSDKLGEDLEKLKTK